MKSRHVTLTIIEGKREAFEREVLRTIWSHTPLEVIDQKIAEFTHLAAAQRNFIVVSSAPPSTQTVRYVAW